MTSAGASFLSSMTRLVLSPAESSLTSAMPSIWRVSTSSLILVAMVLMLDLVGDLADHDAVALATRALDDLGHRRGA